MQQKETKLHKKIMKGNFMEMSSEDYKVLVGLSNFRGFSLELSDAIGIGKSAVTRIIKAGAGKKVYINAIVAFCKEYKAKLAAEGIINQN